jgi:hypothetical protein
MQRKYDKLEQAHVRMKAMEYDKVDVLRMKAELEGRLANAQTDAE